MSSLHGKDNTGLLYGETSNNSNKIAINNIIATLNPELIMWEASSKPINSLMFPCLTFTQPFGVGFNFNQ